MIDAFRKRRNRRDDATLRRGALGPTHLSKRTTADARCSIFSVHRTTSLGLTNDTSNSKWRTPNPRPRSSPRARGRYRTTRRRPASTTLLRTSPSPRRYVRRRDSMGGSGTVRKRRTWAHCSSNSSATATGESGRFTCCKMHAMDLR